MADLRCLNRLMHLAASLSDANFVLHIVRPSVLSFPRWGQTDKSVQLQTTSIKNSHLPKPKLQPNKPKNGTTSYRFPKKEAGQAIPRFSNPLSQTLPSLFSQIKISLRCLLDKRHCPHPPLLLCLPSPMSETGCLTVNSGEALVTLMW